MPKSKINPNDLPKSEELSRGKILKHFGVTAIIDVGANIGQFGKVMKSVGYASKIFSFEPQQAAYELLKIEAFSDEFWFTFPYALGEEKKELTINIAGNSYSSSILEMLPAHEAYAPESKYIDKEIIKVDTLDNVITTLVDEHDVIYLKIDTQGYEKQVLMGAENALSRIKLLQLEISLQPLYENEPLFNEIYSHLSQKGFELLSLEYGIRDEISGCLLQLDGIFINKNIA